MIDRYQITIADSAFKNLKRIPLPWKRRISDVIDRLVLNPFLGSKMWGELQGKRKIRVWPYRVIYSVDEKSRSINILELGHRGHMSYR